MHPRTFHLAPEDLPTHWYNLVADLDTPPPPPLNPATKEPVGPDALARIFPMGVIEQEVSQERWIPIPDPVRQILALWRPTPLYRATRLEAALKTPASIYYKHEGASPTGSHKPNTAVAQAYYNAQEGIKRITTETGAGQWGSSLAFAAYQFGLECVVYMVRVSFEQKPYRKSLMSIWGASVYSSPSDRTQIGRSIQAKDPQTPGSLGIAISEAIEDCVTSKDTRYSLGSVLNHVLLHQTVIGQEAIKQMEMAGGLPDVIYGCAGGGSNFAGLVFPFLREKLEGRWNGEAVAVEPASCPSLTKGEYRYDFGDTAGTTPLLKMYTLGHDFVPPGIHAGGLRYHGMAPLVSHVLATGLIRAEAYEQKPVFEAAVQFAQAEGIVPAPESAHAIRGAINEALRCRDTGEPKRILIGLSGHGLLDLSAYDLYLSGRMA